MIFRKTMINKKRAIYIIVVFVSIALIYGFTFNVGAFWKSKCGGCSMNLSNTPFFDNAINLCSEADKTLPASFNGSSNSRAAPYTANNLTINGSVSWTNCPSYFILANSVVLEGSPTVYAQGHDKNNFDGGSGGSGGGGGNGGNGGSGGNGSDGTVNRFGFGGSGCGNLYNSGFSYGNGGSGGIGGSFRANHGGAGGAGGNGFGGGGGRCMRKHFCHWSGRWRRRRVNRHRNLFS